MSPLDLATYMGAIAGIVASVGIIWQKGVKPVFKFITHIKDIHDIVQELRPNGGHSIKDDVKETRALIEAHVRDTNLHGPRFIVDQRPVKIEEESNEGE